MNEKVNLSEKLALLELPYRPGIVGYLNDYKLVVVKVRGEFVWHTHPETDDLFIVLEGRLIVQLRDGLLVALPKHRDQQEDIPQRAPSTTPCGCRLNPCG